MSQSRNHKGHSSAQTGRKAGAEIDWPSLIERAFPDIVWSIDHSRHDSAAPSVLRHIRLTKESRLFGLFAREVTRATITQTLAEMDQDTLFATLAMTMQAGAFLRRQTPAKRFATTIRGPKPDVASMRLLLKADVFSALLAYGVGDDDAVQRRARRRAEAVLTARKDQPDPGLYALPMAVDTIHVILPTLPRATQIPDRMYMTEALARADDICRCIDPGMLNQWYGFSRAAQDMAWRSASKRSVLGAAFTADAPHIRTIAMTIADLTGLTAHGADQLIGQYSAFQHDDINARAHEHAVDQEFAWVVAQDPISKGSKVFLDAANRQIAALQKGQVVGWCADALHASAKAFDEQGGRDREALLAAQTAFNEYKDTTPWDQLNRLGESIVEKCKQGIRVGLRELYDLATDLHGVRDALDVRMMQEMAPVHALHPAPAFSAPAAAPQAPTPAPVFAPAAPQMSLSVPTLGGSVMQSVPIYAQVHQESDDRAS